MTKTPKTVVPGKHAGISPMRLHKNMVIQCLRMYPQDYRKMVTEEMWAGDIDSYIKNLENSPLNWFVGGKLTEK